MAIAGGARRHVTTDAELRGLFEEAFDDVYRYAARLTGSNRSLAEDLVQEAFVGLVRAVRRGDVTEAGAGWLITAVRHRFIDHLRHERVEERALESVARNEAAAASSSDTSSSLPPTSLGTLAPLDRFVLLTHHVDGHSVREVASMIGKSVHATESLLARARHAARVAARVEERHD